MDSFVEQKRAVLIDHLRRHVSGEVRFDETSKRLYSTDASSYQVEPLGVVIPRTVADLQSIVQIALETETPLIARGGGTSLSGQSIGQGVIVDCSKYLNQVLDIDAAGQRVRVQPGAVLDHLNRAVASHGLMFGPDVATASRATLGGMIGNNSAGSHSIAYGKTIDHVASLDAFLFDGRRHRLSAYSRNAWSAPDSPTLDGLRQGIEATVRPAVNEIRAKFPRIIRRVSGYNLDLFAEFFLGESPAATPVTTASHPTYRFPMDRVGLHHLLVGGEGTLGFVCEAELRLIPKPKHLGILIPQFSSLDAAMDCLATCLSINPSAVELLDSLLLRLSRNNLALRNVMSALTGSPEAIFFVEAAGDTDADVRGRLESLARKLTGASGHIANVLAIEPKQRLPLWALRNAAAPLLLGLPGDRKPVTFIEDTAVSPDKLPAFVRRFRKILRRQDADGAFYGHASVGCLHIRPLLNLKSEVDRHRMRRIMEDISDLVLEFGGCLSGEHGDGMARSEWNRKMFGDVVYDAFQQVKGLFDPKNLFNPGKVVHGPPMTENLRLGAGYRPFEPATIYDYSAQEGFVRAIELCNGSGVCRKTAGGTMCPSYRATLDEKDSTRGRANALRIALAAKDPRRELRSSELDDVLDLCLMCKACKSECPSNVDLAKLKAEVLQLRHESRQRPLSHLLMGRIHRWYQLGSKFPKLTNWVQRRPIVRWLMESLAQIDRRRSLPELAATTFRAWFTDRRRKGSLKGAPVLLLDDCFTNFLEPQVGQAAVKCLEATGCSVQLAGIQCCGRALISKGYLREARELVHSQAPRLASILERGAGSGLRPTILGLEPSCLLTLVDDWPELFPSPATKAIRSAARLADAWLSERLDEQRRQSTSSPTIRSLEAPCVVHGHCHQKALVGAEGTVKLLGNVPDLTVQLLDTGCCGMAGSFGYEKKHFDVSVQIANLDLLPALKKTPDALVVAPGVSCRHQIRDLTGRHALHPLEVLADRLAPGVGGAE